MDATRFTWFGHSCVELRTTGGTVQLASSRQQQLGRACQILERVLERCSDLGTIDPQRPTDHVVVAQTTAPILQVGFEQRCHWAEAFPTTTARLVQPLQPHERAFTPLLTRPLLHCRHDVGRTGEASHIEHRGGGMNPVSTNRSHPMFSEFSPASTFGKSGLAHLRSIVGIAPAGVVGSPSRRRYAAAMRGARAPIARRAPTMEERKAIATSLGVDVSEITCRR